MKKLLITIILLSIILTSCKRNIGAMPKDFDFIYTCDWDCINTVDSTFTRQGVGTRREKGMIDTVIKLVLTQAEKKAIYKVMMENDLLEMPLDFKANPKGGFISDKREDHLTVYMNHAQKNIMYYYGDIEYKLDWSKKYLVIAEYLDSVISSRKEVKALPETGLMHP